MLKKPFLLLAIVLLIFGAKLWFIHAFGSPVPYWDQWDGNVFLPWLDGSLTIENLFSPHNEHRIVLSRLLSLGLLRFNDMQWDPLLEMVVNALISTFTALFLSVILYKHFESHEITFLLIVLWVFPYSWENSLGGFHSCWYLMTLLTILALWGGLLHPPWTWPWWIGMLSGVLAYFNLASGFFVLVILVVISLFQPRKAEFPTLIISSLFIVLVLFIFPISTHPQFRASSYLVFLQSFAQALSWPWLLPAHGLLALLTYLPFFMFVIQFIRLPSSSPRERFVLGLGGWVLLQIASIAYARSGPIAPRYMDILALGALGNVLALYCLVSHQTLIRLWTLLVSLGVIALTIVMSPYFEQRHLEGLEHLNNVRHFLLTGNREHLKIKKGKKIPYPDSKRLAGLLSEPRLRALLSYHLATPRLLLPKQETSSFVVNGLPFSTYQDETVWGSYHPLGHATTGTFISEPMTIHQTFLEIPVAGDLGTSGLSLELLLEGKRVPIIISQTSREKWTSVYLLTPQQPFQIVATDQRSDAWLAFAMPRGIGKLSFIVMKLLPLGKLLFILGILWLLVQYFFKKWSGRTAWPSPSPIEKSIGHYGLDERLRCFLFDLKCRSDKAERVRWIL